MRSTRVRPAAWGGGQGAVDHASRLDHALNTPSPVEIQRIIMQTLETTPAEDRAELALALAARGLLVLAHVDGLRAAAAAAYRMADQMAAGAIR